MMRINRYRGAMSKIKYKEGYKYQLVDDYVIQTYVIPDEDLFLPFVILDTNGVLSINRGYAWDGASGPTFNTKSSMRPSLVHDCFCQFMKEGKLDYKKHSKDVHQLFYEMCKEDGMSAVRAKLWHWGVIIGQGGNPDNKDDNEIQIAP